MANSIAKLAILLTADAKGIIAPFQQAGNAVQQLSGKITGMAAQLGLLAGGAGAAGFVGWGVKLAADAEQAAVAFRVLLGSGEKAKALLADIRKFAIETPLNEIGLRGGAQTLLQFGVAGENIMPVLRMLGDLSLGNQERFERLALAFGQISAAGRLTGQDLLQLVNAGFNPLQEISKKTGESMFALKERMSDGNISAREVVEAFKAATSEGGRFYNMMNELANSTTARWTKLVETTGLLAMKLGTQLLPTLNLLMAAASGLVDWFQQLDRSTLVWIGSIGAALYLAPKIVAGIRSIVAAFRAMAAAQAIQQALGGPAGWATLATGLAIAAGAAIAVNSAFDSANKTIAKSSAEAKKAADATQKLNLELFNGPKPDNSAAEAAAKAAEKEAKRMQQLGQQITDSMRTPLEKFADQVGILQDLLDNSAITAETYQRAMAKARDDVREQAKSAKDIKEALDKSDGPVAAFQYGTQAAISAISQSQREQRNAAEAQRKFSEEQRRTNEILTKIERAVKAKDDIDFNEVNL